MKEKLSRIDKVAFDAPSLVNRIIILENFLCSKGLMVSFARMNGLAAKSNVCF